MANLHDIQQAVRELSADDLASFRGWFAGYDADAWNRESERHVAEGRLDSLTEEALKDLRDGRCTAL
jgi:hypothetical protein